MITRPTEPLTGDIITDLLAALRSDLEHAEQGCGEAFSWPTRTYNEGYRDAIRQVIDLVERTQR